MMLPCLLIDSANLCMSVTGPLHVSPNMLTNSTFRCPGHDDADNSLTAYWVNVLAGS